MAKRALVFAGRNGLDFVDLRMNVIRIPEVSLRIGHAQAVFDSMGIDDVDLMALMTANDEHFFRNIALKGLLAAIVQVGLYDRYTRTQPSPEFLVGCSNGDSAMLVAAGRISFEDMVRNSLAIGSLRSSDPVAPLVAQPIPLLSGLSLTEFGTLELHKNDAGDEVYELIQNSSMELKRIVSDLHIQNDVTCFVNIGPGNVLKSSDYLAIGTGDLESVDSIELDPMLGWFWRDMGSPTSQMLQ